MPGRLCTRSGIDVSHAGMGRRQTGQIQVLASKLLKVERLELPQQAAPAADFDQALLAQVATAEFALGKDMAGKNVAVRHDVEERADATGRGGYLKRLRWQRAIRVAPHPGPPDCCADLDRRRRPLGMTTAAS